MTDPLVAAAENVLAVLKRQESRLRNLAMARESVEALADGEAATPADAAVVMALARHAEEGFAELIDCE